MSQADEIRAVVNRDWIEPARKAGKREATVRSGDVHSQMGLKNLMPAVCGAVDAKKFADTYGVKLISRTGPPQGATVEWVFAI